MAGIAVSFEYFPPNTPQGRRSLLRTTKQLQKAKPEFYSVTYGAGGSTRDRTFAVVCEIADAGYAVAPHLSFGADDEETLGSLLQSYRDHGIRRLVALRGDIPSGMGSHRYVRYAKDLISFVRRAHGDWFHIEVAAYPEVHSDSEDPEHDLLHFKAKVDAGANAAITQYFYNADAYFDYVDRARRIGLTVPIVPGIMPITNHDGLVRFSNGCGAEIPRWIKKRLESYRNDEASLIKFGEEVVTNLCARLIDGGVPGIHFYTLNQSAPTLAICSNLKLLGA